MNDEIKNNMAKVVSVLDEMVKWSKQKNLEYKQEKEQVLKSMTNKYNTYLTNSEIEDVLITVAIWRSKYLRDKD